MSEENSWRDGSIYKLNVSSKKSSRVLSPPDWLLNAACRWLVRHYNKNQNNYCYCPGCGLELCRSDSWFSDTDLVRYKCIQCGTRSGWLFGAPASILVESDSSPPRNPA